MKKVFLFVFLFLGHFFSVKAQVTDVKFLIEYNNFTNLYDCKIVVTGGEATTYPQRIQFNSQYTIVVPTGSQCTIEERYNPREANQNYTGTTPCLWEFGSNAISPQSQPENDFYTVFPNLVPPSAYDNLFVGDTISLFSLYINVDPCDNLVRPFENDIDPDDTYPFGGDFNNGFTFGGGAQTYSGNLSTFYGTIEFNGSIEACVASTLIFTPNLDGTWESDNPEVATVDFFSGAISTLSGGLAIITFTDGNNGCTSNFELNVNNIPSVNITGDDELCVGEITSVSPSTDGIWVSNDPSIAVIDNSGHITAKSPGQTTFTFTSIQGCSSETDNIYVLPLNDSSCTVITSTEESIGSEIKIYPNPAIDIMFVESKSTIESISIYDMNYRKTKAFYFSKGIYETQISIEELNPGLYYVVLESGKINKNKKILIK